MRFKNGLAYGDLANAFGVREGTVRMRVSRALAKMRATLERPTEPLFASAAKPELDQRSRAHVAPATPPAPRAPVPARRSTLAGAEPTPAPARKKAGLLRRVFARKESAVAVVPTAEPGHPLAAYFAAPTEGASAALRDRLAARVRGLDQR